MGIEFQCDNCGTVLKTGDETAGKAARCPKCSHLVPIPNLKVAKPPVEKRLTPQNFPNRVNAGNPYAPVGTDAHQHQSITTSSRSSAKSKLWPPVITVLVCSSIGTLMALMLIVEILMVIYEDGMGPEQVIQAFFRLGFLILNLLGVVGCISLLNFQRRALGIAGLICAMLASFSCCFVSLGFAIWAFVMTLDANIVKHFDS